MEWRAVSKKHIAHLWKPSPFNRSFLISKCGMTAVSAWLGKKGRRKCKKCNKPVDHDAGE